MFAPRIAFVDLETTGTSPAGGRVTEVGIVLLETDADGGERVSEWASLVNPGCSIPPFIQTLTGITNSMVGAAPRFAELATEIAERLAGAVFVAHNARFDYGFLRAEFERVGVDFRAPTLCTVRLSRQLYPERSSHSLDALIDRFGLAVQDRHRALGDARLLLAFVSKLYQRLPPAAVDAAAAKLLQRPSVPSHLSAEMLDALPQAPGVYRFYDAGQTLLYVGKSIDLRGRVAAHFQDSRHSKALQLAQEVHRVEWDETAGEFGALLLEALQIKTLQPLHNQRLRRNTETSSIALDELGRARFVPLEQVEAALLPQHYGPFVSRSVARSMLVKLASERELCLRTLGLEKGGKSESAGSPCFARQLRRCRGACVGAESPSEHAERAAQAMAPWRLARWPHPGAIALVERDPLRSKEDWHVFDAWSHLGTVGSHAAAFELAATAPRRFDTDTYRLARLALTGEPAWALELVVL